MHFASRNDLILYRIYNLLLHVDDRGPVSLLMMVSIQEVGVGSDSILISSKLIGL